MLTNSYEKKYFNGAYLFLFFLFFLGGCAGARGVLPDGDRDGARLAPGLAVLYFDGMYRNVSQVPDGDTAMLEKGRPGTPVLSVDHQFGQAEVFDSGRSRGVGVQLKGYIHFETAGRYAFQALSNDGVEIRIDGTRILRDPTVHSDRLSDIGYFTAQKPGWFPFFAKYFQRKGTAALRFYWKTPPMDAFGIIPAEAYGHKEGDSINEKDG